MPKMAAQIKSENDVRESAGKAVREWVGESSREAVAAAIGCSASAVEKWCGGALPSLFVARLILQRRKK